MTRATKYKREFCAQAIKFGKQGKSVTWIASEFGVAKSTLFDWIPVHPEFAEAMSIAKTHSQRWWEDVGQENLEKAGFQGGVWSKNMSARFHDDWREIKSQEISGPNGGPVEVAKIERVIVDPND